MGIAFKSTLYRVSYGNKIGTLNFIWRIDPQMADIEEITKKNCEQWESYSFIYAQ